MQKIGSSVLLAIAAACEQVHVVSIIDHFKVHGSSYVVSNTVAREMKRQKTKNLTSLVDQLLFYEDVLKIR